MMKTTLTLARRLAQTDGRPQQPVMVQTAARLLSGASDTDKDALMRFIAASAQERHDMLNAFEQEVLHG